MILYYNDPLNLRSKQTYSKSESQLKYLQRPENASISLEGINCSKLGYEDSICNIGEISSKSGIDDVDN